MAKIFAANEISTIAKTERQPNETLLSPRVDDQPPDHAVCRRAGSTSTSKSIARALLTNPTVLLMDEPTEGLAPVLVETAYRSAAAAARRSGETRTARRHCRGVAEISSRHRPTER